MEASERVVYLDYNATTPVEPRVLAAMLPFLDNTHFGNASSKHAVGKGPREALAKARKQVASLINAVGEDREGEEKEEEEERSERSLRLEREYQNVIFTSGGTEANNQALICSALLMKRRRGPGSGNHIVTSNVEHWAVAEALKHLEECHDFTVTRVPVDHNCLVDAKAVAAAVTSSTVLVSVMHANNEIGSVQPITEIASLCHDLYPDILIHTDAAQSLGKVPVDVQHLGVDLLTIAGHKLYGPKGVGALYIRSSAPAFRQELPGPYVLGASQEMGLRGGTENVASNVALGAACAIAEEEFHENVKHMVDTRARLVQGLEAFCVSQGQKMVRNGRVDRMLPNTLSVSFPGINAYDLLELLKDNVCFSAGAACHSGGPVASETLQRMQLEDAVAIGTVRISTGKLLTNDDVDFAVQRICAALSILLGR